MVLYFNNYAFTKLQRMEKVIIGRIDRADFPKLGLSDIDIKIDTGAYTSSIHCNHIRAEDKVGVELEGFDTHESLREGEEKKGGGLAILTRKKDGIVFQDTDLILKLGS